LSPRRRDYETDVLTRQEEIGALCETCLKEGRFAFDTEFVMEDRFQPEVCLVQVATEHTVALIDPFLALDIAPLWNLVADPHVEKVVHAGQEDLALAVQHTGRIPQNIFDVQIAAGFAGLEYPLSLMRLVQATQHVRLHKSKTLTDWRKRPLTTAQLEYAAEDVAYLLEGRRIILEKLMRFNRVDWVREEMRRYEEKSAYHREDVDKLFRIKGTGSLRPRQLAIVRDLLGFRDELAQRYNRPARIVLRDHLLIEIARLELATFDEIRDLRGINLRDTDVRSLAEVVKRARSAPTETWPQQPPRESETPQEAVLMSLITAVIRSYCLEHDLAYSIVATQRSIRELVRHRMARSIEPTANIDLLQGWRGRSVGIMLDEVLTGQRQVRVEPVDGSLGLHVVPADNGN